MHLAAPNVYPEAINPKTEILQTCKMPTKINKSQKNANGLPKCSAKQALANGIKCKPK